MKNFDVAIIGGGAMGASVAWHLLKAGFDGSIALIERDPGHEASSTAHSNSCLRQQFSTPLNVEISRYAVDYIARFAEEMEDERAGPIDTHYFGYLYLADSEEAAETLTRDQAMQASLGAATRLLTPDEIAQAWPFFDLSGIVAGTHNPEGEGWFDGGAMFQWWLRAAKARGAAFVQGEVVDITREGGRVTGLHLADGSRIGAGLVVNAAGPRAGQVAAMAGLSLPVHPVKRMTWVVEAAAPLDRDLPLTVDPSGVHMRTDGRYYMIGGAPRSTAPVAPDDFGEPPGAWEEEVWPRLAARIPQFDRLRVVNSWAGHYAWNSHDQNAIVGPHPALENFLFINGFSGHGLQQAPAMGRGLAEWILHGRFVSLDLSAFSLARLTSLKAQAHERAVI